MTAFARLVHALDLSSRLTMAEHLFYLILARYTTQQSNCQLQRRTYIQRIQRKI